MASGSVAINRASPALAEALRALAMEAPASLEQAAELALRAHARGEAKVAAAAAGIVLLTEHLQATQYRHAFSMLGVLAACGPEVGEVDEAGLLAWAGAAIARDYGVLPSWPAANIAWLMERAETAHADIALALACALGEICERNGEDAAFAALQAQVSSRELGADASPLWRGHWAIVAAWHLCAFARVDQARQQLALAQSLAAEHRLPALSAQAGLQRARLVECWTDPEAALALAQRSVATGDPARTPLWFADLADVQCLAALRSADYHAAVGHARRAIGHLQVSKVWPGYQVTYRVNEAYALIGIGAADQAADRFRALIEVPLPQYLTERVRCLAALTALLVARRGASDAEVSRTALEAVIRSLRQLEWPGVLRLLPEHAGQIFCIALVHGIELDWVRAAIRTRKLPAPAGAPECWPWPVKIRALGSFELELADLAARTRLEDARKAASKPLDLLRYLAASGLEPVSADAVALALWPGDGREGRRKALEVTVARLRRQLGQEGAIVVQDRSLGLNRACVWLDVQALQDSLAACESAAPGSEAADKALDTALLLYRGACLAQLSQPWALAAADRLRSRLAAALIRLQQAQGPAGSRAREFALRSLAADPGLAGFLFDEAQPSPCRIGVSVGAGDSAGPEPRTRS